MTSYAAFLRGINVGGKHTISMADLKDAFASFGVTDIRTIQAAGNVLFTSKLSISATLTRKIESGLKDRFGFEVPVIVRSARELQDIVDCNPFARAKVTKSTRLNVSFLAVPHAVAFRTPYTSEDGYLKILRVTEREIFSVIELGHGTGTVDLMAFLEMKFGKEMTTRTWATVVKCAGHR